MNDTRPRAAQDILPASGKTDSVRRSLRDRRSILRSGRLTWPIAGLCIVLISVLLWVGLFRIVTLLLS